MSIRRRYARKDGACKLMTRDGIPGVKLAEIDPGRAPPADWNKWVIEPWAERKMRLQQERRA